MLLLRSFLKFVFYREPLKPLSENGQSKSAKISKTDVPSVFVHGYVEPGFKKNRTAGIGIYWQLPNNDHLNVCGRLGWVTDPNIAAQRACLKALHQAIKVQLNHCIEISLPTFL